MTFNLAYCEECVHNQLGHHNACNFCKANSKDLPVYFRPELHQEHRGEYFNGKGGPICKTCAKGIHIHHKAMGVNGERDCKNLIPGGQCMCYEQEEGRK
jgi:hypothetical protein